MCTEEVWVQSFCGQVRLVALNVEVFVSQFLLLLSSSLGSVLEFRANTFECSYFFPCACTDLFVTCSWLWECRRASIGELFQHTKTFPIWRLSKCQSYFQPRSTVSTAGASVIFCHFMLLYNLMFVFYQSVYHFGFCWCALSETFNWGYTHFYCQEFDVSWDWDIIFLQNHFCPVTVFTTCIKKIYVHVLNVN